MQLTKIRIHCSQDWLILTLTSLCFVVFTLTGCAIVGPRSIGMGRADYNEAINRTEDEQMLLSIVKGRYGETFSLLFYDVVRTLWSVSIAAASDQRAAPVLTIPVSG